jgi:4-cresol dehydrogenase (hydroxylating)
MICGMEVVLATGELVRTGMGATAGSKEWQVYKNGFGPIWDGAFTQSNFAIVTKMGIWLMPQPAAMAGVRISCANEADLPLLVDTLRPLRLNDTINATYTIANGVRMAHRAGLRANIYEGKDSIPRDVVAKQLAKQGEGWWSVIFNLFDNSVAGIDLKIGAIHAAFSKIPGAKVDVRQRWAKGQPQAAWMRQDVSLGPLGVVDWYGGRGGHTDWGPVMAPVGARVQQVYDLAYKRFTEHGIDCYVGMFGLGQRAIVMVADIIYDRDDEDMIKRARALFKQLCDDAAAIGVALYRSHITFMDDAADMQTFNNHAMMRFNERVKAALDPNGILAPGKQGIWPAAYKERS